MRRRCTNALQATIAAAVALSASGCFAFTTKKEGRDLRRDVNHIEASLPKLQHVLDQATSLLTRNSADLGAEVNTLGEEQKKLTGLVMEASRYAEEVRDESKRQEQRIADLEKRIADLEGKAEVSNKSAPQLWEEGMSALQAKNYEQARSSFRSLLVKYPTNDKADDAQLQRGESYFKERKYQESLGEYQRVFEKYPDSSLADDAAFRAGEAAEELKWCTDARAYYGLLIKKWPRSDLAKKARSHDAALKKSADNRKKCQS
ncbi:MAG TPA: tetratricopeptide repeat protein [Kofleriaceae bacterium]|nr:tetratricopeptide repeat protein [Kofleriaceae bacterium]